MKISTVGTYGGDIDNEEDNVIKLVTDDPCGPQ